LNEGAHVPPDPGDTPIRESDWHGDGSGGHALGRTRPGITLGRTKLKAGESMNLEQALFTFAGVSFCAVMILSLIVSLILERAERKHARKMQHPMFKQSNDWEDLQ
jgi:hypothetical protein